MAFRLCASLPLFPVIRPSSCLRLRGLRGFHATSARLLSPAAAYSTATATATAPGSSSEPNLSQFVRRLDRQGREQGGDISPEEMLVGTYVAQQRLWDTVAEAVAYWAVRLTNNESSGKAVVAAAKKLGVCSCPYCVVKK